MNTANCRDTRCNAPIVYLITRNNKLMPCDSATVHFGDTHYDPKRHTSHFATCPFAKEFRKPKKELPKV